ncbi:MAG: DHH family phosphoesterase [Bellilinea sp.]
MNDALHTAIQERLSRAERVLITSHVRPDGDAVGALLGLGLVLEASGRSVQMVLRDGVPENMLHLKGSEQIVSTPAGDFDTFIVLDSGELKRVGQEIVLRKPDIQIDHHLTNTRFGVINLVEPEAVATSAILAESLPRWGFSITQDAASALLTGILTDTMGFRTSNMNSRALRVAADLIDLGANLPELYFEALITRSIEAARYWGMGLSSLQKRDRLIWATLRAADRQAVGYNNLDDADLTNLLSSISDGDIAVLFIEHAPDLIKVSWRSRPGWDVSQIAEQFGGGGHAAAAGAEIPGTLEGVQALVLDATEKLLQNGNER